MEECTALHSLGQCSRPKGAWGQTSVSLPTATGQDTHWRVHTLMPIPSSVLPSHYISPLPSSVSFSCEVTKGIVPSPVLLSLRTPVSRGEVAQRCLPSHPLWPPTVGLYPSKKGPLLEAVLSKDPQDNCSQQEKVIVQRLLCPDCLWYPRALESSRHPSGHHGGQPCDRGSSPLCYLRCFLPTSIGPGA